MSGYASKNRLLLNTSQAITTASSSQVISDTFKIEGGDSTQGKVDVIFTIGVAGTLTFKLQDSHDGQTWYDVKTVTSTATKATIAWLDTVAGDQATLPVRPLARVVCSSDATATGTITAVWQATRL